MPIDAVSDPMHAVYRSDGHPLRCVEPNFSDLWSSSQIFARAFEYWGVM